MDVENKLRAYLQQRFGSYHEGIQVDDSLEGIVDSIGLFELVEFIEKNFNVSIPNQEFSPQRFSSITSILATIDEFKR
jgi:acyl carrier protein